MRDDEPVYYCATCGRSRRGHTMLSNGKISDCAGEIRTMSLSEWRSIISNGDLVWQLTDAGRAALDKVEG